MELGIESPQNPTVAFRLVIIVAVVRIRWEFATEGSGISGDPVEEEEVAVMS